MDLDGDGVSDLVSGSYTKGVFFYKGRAVGTYDAPVNLRHANGAIVKPDSALAPAFGDWDHDGDQDMVLGTISGPVYYLANKGRMTFDNPVKMKSGNREISAPDGGPCLHDMDSDGDLDLLLGDGNGGLTVYYGKSGSSSLRAGEVILKPENDLWSPQKADATTGVLQGGRPGVRIKPFVCDWNGDSKPDILAGDFLMIQPPARELSPERQARLKRLEAERNAVTTKMQQRVQTLMDAARKSQRKSSAKASVAMAYSTSIQKDKQYKEYLTRYSQLSNVIEQLKPRALDGGYVWVLYGR